MPEGYYRASRAFKMDSRLIPLIETFRGRLCGNDSVGRFLFYVDSILRLLITIPKKAK